MSPPSPRRSFLSMSLSRCPCRAGASGVEVSARWHYDASRVGGKLLVELQAGSPVRLQSGDMTTIAKHLARRVTFTFECS